MKKRSLQAKLLIATIAVVGLCCWYRLSYSESLTVLPLKYELSAIDGGMQEVIITIRNNSWRSTTLGRVTTSCGCTAPQNGSEQTVLASGETHRLSVSVRIPPYGRKSSTLTLADAFGKTHVVEFEMQGLQRQLPFLDSDLERLELRSDDFGKTIETSFSFRTVESSESAIPWIASVKPVAEGITCEIESTEVMPTLDGVERTYSVKLRYKFTEPDNHQNPVSLMLVDRDGADTGICAATVRCSFRHDLTTTPANLIFSANSNPQGHFVIRSARKDLPEDISIVPSVDWLETNIIHRTESHMVVEVRDTLTKNDDQLMTGNITVGAANSPVPALVIEVIHRN